MPRKPRSHSSTNVYHWINRGVNQKRLFHFKDDYLYFLKLLNEHKDPHGVQIYHYCLVTNHVHMLLKCEDRNYLSRFSQMVQRRYAYYYCKAHKWRGQVFQRMYKCLPIEQDSYLLECGRYIERNPIRAKLASKPEEYPHSSYIYYSQGQDDQLLTASPGYLSLADSDFRRQELYRVYVSQDRLYESLIDDALLKR